MVRVRFFGHTMKILLPLLLIAIVERVPVLSSSIIPNSSLRFKRQQTDDQFYYMNRGMLMIGQGLTELLTNQKYNGNYHSGVMEPNDPQQHATQQQWYKEYFGPHGRF